MRTLILVLTATVTFGLAGAAQAQRAGVGVDNGSFAGTDYADANAQYDHAIMMLKKKMERITREDGGKLTPEHAAGLQAELDKVNHDHGLKAAPARRASFGHYTPAPEASSPG